LKPAFPRVVDILFPHVVILKTECKVPSPSSAGGRDVRLDLSAIGKAAVEAAEAEALEAAMQENTSSSESVGAAAAAVESFIDQSATISQDEERIESIQALNPSSYNSSSTFAGYPSSLFSKRTNANNAHNTSTSSPSSTSTQNSTLSPSSPSASSSTAVSTLTPSQLHAKLQNKASPQSYNTKTTQAFTLPEFFKWVRENLGMEYLDVVKGKKSKEEWEVQGDKELWEMLKQGKVSRTY
jgi:hypothetical protein